MCKTGPIQAESPGDMQHSKSAAHLVQVSILFESCSDQIALGRAARVAPCSSIPWQLYSYSDVFKNRASDEVWFGP